MSNYVLGNNGESTRLNYQSEQRNYDSYEEISDLELKLKTGAIALDAGCGTGILARRISDANPIFQARFDGKDLTFLNHSGTITEGYLRVSFYIFLHFSEFGLSVACFWLACLCTFQSV